MLKQSGKRFFLSWENQGIFSRSIRNSLGNNPQNFIWGAFDSAKKHKRQRCKRQSVTAKREESQTPKFV